MTLCLPLQEHLEILIRDNEQLKAEVKELLSSSALAPSSRDQGKSYLFLVLVLFGLFFLQGGKKLLHIIFLGVPSVF